ncbi:c-type cytochrome [Bradyrhizobium sp.]|uniref:c-type cytochrome n=1 Tax=Bradyrhizobium sp. TaxID=376 RepID=UPI001EB4B25E|nr:c-type cytochrome [Bradyrhizobium sp.]MBV8920151.1 c-type cytochrome [Bradyrhizobium sp.]MBV9981108.1 c-type cytochrome [Bradyrhizobium sp.]
MGRAFGSTVAEAVLVVLLAAALSGCGQGKAAGPANFNGDPKRGADLVRSYGCGGCHDIPGIANADGNVGPPLHRIGARTYIAGFLQNSPDNMAFWIQDPQKVLPGNAMPQMGIPPDQARDIAAFLYTLK